MYVLQPPVRLYDSRVWTLQRDSYTAHGPRAWLDGGVPMQVVNNPYIARAYARVIHGLLHDLRGLGPLPEAPVTLLELGSGSGCFGFLLLRALEALRASSALPSRPYRLIMTDLPERNLEAWAAHPQLAPYVAQGILDFARFDAADPGPLAPRSGPPPPEGLPLVLLANYLFDTIASDAFRCAGGALSELRLRMTLPAEPAADAPLSEALRGLECQPVPTPIDGPYYREPHRDRALAETAAALTEDTDFLFPEGALRIIEHLTARSAGLFLLSSDKGYATPDDFEGTADIELTVHGEAFSVMVNYDAIGRYVRSRGGVFRCDPFREGSLISAVGALGLGPIPHAMDAFERELCAFSPLNYQDLVTAMSEGDAPPPLAILRLLRLSAHDPEVLLQLLDALMDRAVELEEEHVEEFITAAEATWDNRYDLGDSERDLAFAAGGVLQCADRPEEALRWYRRSLETCGPHPATHLNMGMCLEHLERLDEALAQVEEALALAPDAADALTLRDELLDQLR